MKVQINGFITYDKPQAWEKDKHGFSFSMFDPAGWKHNTAVVVQPESIEVDVPDDFDPRPQMVKTLEAQKEAARKEFANTVMRIDRQINELLALEHTA